MLTLPYLGDFGTSTAWGGSAPLRYFLCSLSYVNQIWYVTMSKNDLKCGTKLCFFYNDVIMTSFPFQISEFPSLSSWCSKSNAQLPQKNKNSLTFMLNQSYLGMLQIIRVKIFYKCIIKDGGMPPQTCACHYFQFCIVWVHSTKSAPTNFV